MNRVIHFEIQADDINRAILFYQKVFGWTIKKWEGTGMDYWLIMTGPKEEPGIDGGMAKRQTPGPCGCIGTYVCTIGVKDIDETTKKITENGGAILMPKQELMGVGLFASCKDTEGNTFSVMQATANPPM
jgi:predicted enzyme related to lactoylglutathione lyase